MVNNNSQPNLNNFSKTSNELVYAFLPLISDPGKADLKTPSSTAWLTYAGKQNLALILGLKDPGSTA